MTFTFNTGIPAANNNPSVDQPDMLNNNISTSGILAVDHITFNAINGGTHKQVTYIDKFPPVAQADPVSVAYTNVGVADPTHPQNFWRNSQGIFPLSSIRAFGSFATTANGDPGTPPVFLNQINIDTANATHILGVYTIPLVTNAVNTNNVVVLLTQQSAFPNVSYSYTFSGGVLTITNNSVAGAVIFNFLVLQI